MSRINQIQEGLRQIEGGRFQTLANQYLCRRYSLGSCVHYGSNFGTDKTTTGVPDMYAIEDGKFFFGAFTCATSDIKQKLLADAHDCLDESKTHIDSSLIDRIVLCHTTPRLDPAIAAEVQHVDPRIEIIGPEAIAEDLDKKYASLAFLTLGIPLGKGSFISPKAFADRNSQGRFTTDQSKPLLYRDDDISNIVESINQSKAVLIHGRSGCGKTKIALEACVRFSEETHWDFLVLDSKYSDNIDEDIELVLDASENLIILVDDANNQVSLNHLLSVCAGNDNLKIVFTCRKMHYNELVLTIDARLKHLDIELCPLAQEQINAVLENEYGIVNRAFRERVAAIANGNLRLAIMAAMSLTEGDREAVREPYDLLKFYMDSALSEYTDRERRLIELVAVYDGFDIAENNPCYVNLLESGYSKSEIEETISKLEKQEIVTTLRSPENELGIRMEEQNLRDFLICHHFAKANHGSYADFIVATAGNRQAPYLKAAKSMVEVCGSESVNDYIRRECEKAWGLLKNMDKSATDQFLVAFNQFVPVQALVYVSDHIKESSEGDVSEEILDRNMTSGDSTTLSILVSLMDTVEHSDTALHLFVQCVGKGCEKPSQYKWACGVGNAFSENVNREGFKLETRKLDALADEYQNTESRNIAACLILLADTYLSSRAERYSQDGGTYTIGTLSYNFTPELAELHARCFQTLSLLIGSDFEERVRSTFRRHFSFYGDSPEPSHATQMNAVLSKIEDLFPLYIRNDSTDDLSCSLCINQIYTACGQKPPLDLEQFSQETIDALDCENAVSFSKSSTKTLPADMPTNRLIGALNKLIEDCMEAEKRWDASQAIKEVILEIAKREPGRAPSVISSYMTSSGGLSIIPSEAIHYLANVKGRESLRKELSASLEEDLYPILFDVFDHLAIDDNPNDDELDRMLIRLEDGRCHLDLETLEIIEPNHPGYLFSYTTKFSENVKDAHDVWRFFGNSTDANRVRALDLYFSTDPSHIIRLYFCALEGFSHFDYNFAFLRVLNRIDSSVSGLFLEYVSNLDYHSRHELLQRVSAFWTVQDEFAWTFLKTLIDDALKEPFGRFELSSLFPVHNATALLDENFWHRLESLIKENSTSAQNLSAISWVMSECDDQARIRVLTFMLTLDNDGISVGHLSLRRSSMSGSPEAGFIPAKKREIEAIRAVIAQLPSDISYLQHKEWLSKEIGYIETDIDNEKWDLFHGRQ